MLLIPANARWQESAGTAGLVGFGKRPFDAPIVRHIEFSPGTVVELRLLRTGGIGFQKPPVCVEGHGNTGGFRRRGNQHTNRHRCEPDMNNNFFHLFGFLVSKGLVSPSPSAPRPSPIMVSTTMP